VTWGRLGIVKSHFSEYASEFVEMAALMFFLVPFEALLFGLTSPVALHVPPVLCLFAAGTGFGIVSWLISLTPFGRLSGAHMNPAVSIGFCLIGKMRVIDATGYVAAQLLGSLFGVVASMLLAPAVAFGIKYGSVPVAPALTPTVAFALEALGTAALTVGIFVSASVEALQRWTFVWVSLCLGMSVVLIGPLTGSSLNPARWFGPAYVVKEPLLWHIYFVAPILGAAIAAGAFVWTRNLHKLRVRTGKLTPDDRHRSLFINIPNYASVWSARQQRSIDTSHTSRS
jgi:aquaporin Z